jgi:peroxiredoxin
LALYQQVMTEFEKQGAQMLGISVDSVWCHMAFARNRKLRFPLLSDFEPKGHVSQLYSAYRRPEGMSERALYLIDSDGTVAWSYISPIHVNPGADGILRALEELSQKEGANERDDVETNARAAGLTGTRSHSRVFGGASNSR